MSTMKCRSCHTPMVVDRCESSSHATTRWHQCPLCKQVRMTSDPMSASPEAGSKAYLYDEGEYPTTYADASQFELLHNSADLIS